MEYHKLSNNWTLWFHNIDNYNYTLESYKNIYNFNSIEEFILLYRKINNFSAGMFFLMKNNITPQWENKDNKNGGYLSFKIYKKNINNIWFKFCSLIITNSLLINHNDDINGISLSPKINNCIIKIWFKDKKKYENFYDKEYIKKIFDDLLIFEDSRFNIYKH